MDTVLPKLDKQKKFDHFNNLISNAHNCLMTFEEKLISSSSLDLSINEIHTLEAIGASERGRRISEVAKHLHITGPSVTAMVNRLVKKGYVEKKPCDKDARSVYAVLTRSGEKVKRSHEYFHRRMTREIMKQMTDAEQEAFEKGVKKLIEFFDKTTERAGK